LRTDLSIKELTYIESAITMGFLLTDQFLPEHFKLFEEHAAELLADVVKRTFASTVLDLPKYSQEASQALIHYMERETKLIKDMEQKETET
jgi:hypothetical protein